MKAGVKEGSAKNKSNTTFHQAQFHKPNPWKVLWVGMAGKIWIIDGRCNIWNY